MAGTAGGSRCRRRLPETRCAEAEAPGTSPADNATRHGSTQLELSARRQEDVLLIKVADNGEGVTPNNRSQIFDSFFTTQRDSGGTGMGLAIVRAMLAAHGGAIRLLDTEQGTAFELTIPIAGEPQA